MNNETTASQRDELQFNAQRLRNVALLVGLTGAIPDDDATLDGARGAVLGMIAGRLRGEAKIDALAAPMVADPAGVAACTCPSGNGSLRWPCPQHPPELDPVVEANRALLHARSQLGIKKYGGTLDAMRHPRRALLQHALEEALDLSNYLQADIQAIDREAATVKAVPSEALELPGLNRALEIAQETMDGLDDSAQSMGAWYVRQAIALVAAPLADKTGGGE